MGGAAVAVPAIASVASGAMSGKGGKGGGPAKLPGGMQGLLGPLSGLAGQLDGGAFGGALSGDPGSSGATAMDALVKQLAGGGNEAFNTGVSNLQTGANTGYLPDVMGAMESYMMPGLERAFNRGAASLREQGALTGNYDSSGQLRDIMDFRQGLEADFGNQVASVYGSAVPAAIGQRGASSQALAGLPGMLQQGVFGPAASHALSSSQFDRSQPLAALGALTSGAGQLPFYSQGGKGGGKGGGGGGGKGGGAGKLLSSGPSPLKMFGGGGK